MPKSRLFCAGLPNSSYLLLESTAGENASGGARWDSTTPNSTTFRVGTSTANNTSAATYVTYIFATLPGISKVGGYAGNDPHLSLNTTAEVTTDDSINSASSGFIVNQVAATNVNVTSATYIFLAIA